MPKDASVFETNAHPHSADQPIDSAPIGVSDQQWIAILERVRTGKPVTFDQEQCRRLSVRDAFQTRCLLRIENDSTTYAVRTQDLSAGGLRFVHSLPIRPTTRCTLALQPARGLGRILAGSVAWCKLVELPDPDLEAFDIGIQFDQPTDTQSLSGAA